MESGTEGGVNFKTTCRYCHHENNTPDYSCNCRSDAWLSSYRTLYVDFDTEKLKDLAQTSFRSYSLNHPRGILQYRLLPHEDQVKNEIPPVGLTPLYHMDSISKQASADIFLKDEGKNPSGCFKDRETTMCILNSRKRNLEKAVIYSSGNAAASAAHFSEKTEHGLIAFVPGDTYPEKIDYIRNHGADVIVIGDENTNFEQGYELFSQLNEQKIFARTGFDNWSVCNPYRVEGDKTIAIEIVKQLSGKSESPIVPDYVIVPTANGSCLAGIWKGFKELYETEIISKLPHMVSAGIDHANPTAKSVRLQETKKPVRCDVSKSPEADVEVGSIIVAERGYDSMEAASAVLQSGGEALEINTSDINQALVDFLELEQHQALDHRILPEPAGLTSLAGVSKMMDKGKISPSDRVVCISTGDGLKAQKTIHSLLREKSELLKKADQILETKKALHNGNGTTPGKEIHLSADIDFLKQSFLELQNQHY